MKSKEELAEEYRKQFTADGSHMERCSHMSFIAGYEAAQQWIPVTPETRPKAREAVNIIAVTDNGKRYRTIAYFIPEKTVLASGFFDDCCGDLEVYDEEIDEYWVAEGWFEWQSVSEIHYHISDRITHYLPIPKLPTG